VTDTTVPGFVTGTPDDDYGRMIGALRGFLDQLAGARPEPVLVRGLEAALTRWSEELGGAQVPEGERLFGHRSDLPGRGQTMSPWLMIDRLDETGLDGTVRFGRYFLGAFGAIHGGAVSLIFDEILGRAAAAAGPGLARTAYLHVNYRAVTPPDQDLRVTARLVSLAGRKRLVTGEIYAGTVLCCDAEALFVELKPAQP
jgi:acyl-coenzyme A thioesterase PaaI-like protein